ncbi:hypothetical protein [uncultured Ruminococcus sp.]|uniref:hypothetical protein n=1 Tax=uncultured Ruminococcus sp. TaxID=165186 RepID=UPI00265F460B|nr:hypothetical protein [uncultured Ruminococcus sp.]
MNAIRCAAGSLGIERKPFFQCDKVENFLHFSGIEIVLLFSFQNLEHKGSCFLDGEAESNRQSKQVLSLNGIALFQLFCMKNILDIPFIHAVSCGDTPEVHCKINQHTLQIFVFNVLNLLCRSIPSVSDVLQFLSLLYLCFWHILFQCAQILLVSFSGHFFESLPYILMGSSDFFQSFLFSFS